ncbi:hypothetical protein GCM10022224_068710 [Nonomuraea antimicrobica]|uniref:Phage integrase family protein n=1 Tax=Nonomuraea antimicrobica TaxID=561173 RepID=A0ABP7CRK2_9ACTN
MGHDSVRAALIYQHSVVEADQKITEDASGSSKELPDQRLMAR